MRSLGRRISLTQRRIYGASSFIIVSTLTPLVLRATSRVRRLNRSTAFGAIVRLTRVDRLKAEREKLPFLRSDP
jgi:hypothetical protein